MLKFFLQCSSSKFHILIIFTDPNLDGNQRITILQQNLSELRKTYNAVKSELAAIERRRKKLKRREREGKRQTSTDVPPLPPPRKLRKTHLKPI